MTDNTLEKICNELILEAEKNRNIVSLFLFGSSAHGTADEFSDVDIYIITTKKEKYGRKYEKRYGKDVDIIIETIKEVNECLQADKNSVRRITSCMIANARILYQKNNMASKLQKIAQKNLLGKTKYVKSEIVMHKYSIADFLGDAARDLRNGDAIAFGVDAQLLINNCIEMTAKVAGEHLQQPKELASILRRYDRVLVDMLESFYSATSLKNKMEVLKKIADYTVKQGGGPLPDTWKL